MPLSAGTLLGSEGKSWFVHSSRLRCSPAATAAAPSASTGRGRSGDRRRPLRYGRVLLLLSPSVLYCASPSCSLSPLLRCCAISPSSPSPSIKRLPSAYHLVLLFSDHHCGTDRLQRRTALLPLSAVRLSAPSFGACGRCGAGGAGGVAMAFWTFDGAASGCTRQTSEQVFSGAMVSLYFVGQTLHSNNLYLHWRC